MEMQREDESDAVFAARLLMELEARDCTIRAQEERIKQLESELAANSASAAGGALAGQLLRQLDTGDGSVRHADLLSVFKTLDPNIAIEHLRMALCSMDSYDDGRVSLEEFASWLYGSGSVLAGEQVAEPSPATEDDSTNGQEDFTPQAPWELASAASEGDIFKLRHLLQARVAVDTSDCRGSALLAAARSGKEACVKQLLEARACVNATDKKGSTPLISASRRGHSDSISLLVEARADVHVADKVGGTAVCYAAQSGHPSSLALLLAVRADPDARDYEGTPALGCAAYSDHGDCVSLLAKARADMGAVDGDGQTALVIAARRGLKDGVAALLDARTDLHSATRSGDLALSWAVLFGHADCVAMLLAGGANPNAEQASTGSPVLRFAAEQHNGSHSFTRMAIELIKASADLEALPPQDTMCEALREFVNAHDAEPLLALTVHVIDSEPEGCVSISCTNMAGEEMAAARGDLARPFSVVRAELRRELCNAPCKLMLPSGHVIAPRDDARLLADVLGRTQECAT